MARVLGIDEAGKGPVIGPLVICGYSLDEKKEHKLRGLNVKDSKMLAPARRAFLEKKLKKIANDFLIVKIPAQKIDALRTITNLNKIEIKHMQHIIDAMGNDKVIIDAIEADISKFARKITSKLKNKNINIIAENYADKNYPVVSAASILAKVERDRAIEKLHKIYGFFGTGYPSDERTINFLKAYLEKNNRFPACVRKSWITAQVIKKEKEQQTLLSFQGR